jgi:thioredoxin-related protein
MPHSSKQSPDLAAPAVLSRRALLAGGAALLTGVPSAFALPAKDADGLLVEPWFTKSTRNLSTDFTNATNAGKNFILIWEMRDCPWCKLMHMENFAREDIAAYLRENFSVVQLNLKGKRDLTGFDGKKQSEEALSYKLDVNSTPTVQFFKPSDAGRTEELGRIGYVKPDEFLTMLKFIRERGYDKGTYEEWVKNRGSAG